MPLNLSPLQGLLNTQPATGAVAPNAANYGTGAVDWGQYVAGNQGTINRDRGTVQQYLTGQSAAQPIASGPTAAPVGIPIPNGGRNEPNASTFSPVNHVLPDTTAPNNPNEPGYSYTPPTVLQQATANVPQPAPTTVTQPDWTQMTSALQTPTGFSQDLQQAQHPGQTLALGTQANGVGNAFDSALEGQNATALAPGAATTGYGAPASALPAHGGGSAPQNLGGFLGANPGFAPTATPAKQSPSPGQGPTDQSGPSPQWQQYLKNVKGGG
jgi:hypothetical protein